MVAQNSGRYICLLLALIAAVHCGQSPPGADEQLPASLPEKVRELKRVFPRADVEIGDTGNRIVRVRHLRAQAGLTDAETIAVSLLKTPALASALGVSTDLRELCPPVIRADPQLPHAAVVRMQQCMSGIKVLGAELVMNVRSGTAPAIDTLTSTLTVRAPPSLQPKITAAAAERSVEAGLEPSTVAQASTPTELVVFDPAMFQLPGTTRLCWLVRRGAIVSLVDADDGSVIRQYSEAPRGPAR